MTMGHSRGFGRLNDRLHGNHAVPQFLKRFLGKPAIHWKLQPLLDVFKV